MSKIFFVLLKLPFGEFQDKDLTSRPTSLTMNVAAFVRFAAFVSALAVSAPADASRISTIVDMPDDQLMQLMSAADSLWPRIAYLTAHRIEPEQRDTIVAEIKTHPDYDRDASSMLLALACEILGHSSLVPKP